MTNWLAYYFSQFNSEYSGQYECELKWKDDMEFNNTYVGGTDVLKVEDYGIFECIDSIFPGRYKDYWNTVGRFAKRYDYAGSYTLVFRGECLAVCQIFCTFAAVKVNRN